jgi:hypothetical protein
MEPIGSGPVFRNQDLIRCLHQLAMLSREACDEVQGYFIESSMSTCFAVAVAAGIAWRYVSLRAAGVARSDGRA